MPGLGRYLYLQVSDHFVFDGDVDCELEVRRRPGPLLVEYDSRDGNATLAGAYTKSRARASRPAAQPGDPGDGWIVEVYDLAGARFANRQNGGADLRFVLPQDDSAAIAELTLRRRR